MAAKPTFYVAFLESLAGQARTPNADWVAGCNWSATCCCGIGISTETTNLEESLPSWTLLNQSGGARTPQLGQSIGNAAGGGFNTAIYVGDNSLSTGNGSYVGNSANATLTTLEDGWVGV